MKLNIDANTIKSPLNEEFVIADRIQLETDNLSIMLNAMDINIPINNANDLALGKFNYEGRQKEGNWMSYWVNVKAKDLIELYPQVHAHLPGQARNQTPYDFQLTIGHGIQVTSKSDKIWSSDPEKRFVEVYAMEAGTPELAVRAVLGTLAEQLLKPNRDNAHIVNMVGVHIAEQLIHLGMTTFKQGDIKVNGFLETHSGLVQAERMWRLGNPGTSKLSLRQTLLTQQTGPNTRTTHLIGPNEHQVYRIDGKYEHNQQAMMQPQHLAQNATHLGFSVQGYPHAQMQPPSVELSMMAAGMLSESEACDAHQAGKIDFNQLTTYLMSRRNQMPSGVHPSQSAQIGMTPRGYAQDINPAIIGHPTPTSYAQGLGSLIKMISGEEVSHEVPAYHNRTLNDDDLGGRDNNTPIKGAIVSIEVSPVLITEETANRVIDGTENAYGVYRREKSDGIAFAVHVGDFLTSAEATAYGDQLAKKYSVACTNLMKPTVEPTR
jgi:hypothetical protein